MSAPSSSASVRSARTLPLLIAALSTMGPFAIDAYLPSFHEVRATLHASETQVQQSLTAFLLPYAFMCLWHGAISDALGRRRVILWNLVIMAMASVGCALAPNIHFLWAFRIVQGLSAGIFVVGRAVVRDLYEGPMAQRVISQISVLFAIAPAVAPVLGGQLQALFGWRSVFWFLTAFATGIWAWAALALPESLPPARRLPLRASHLARAYAATLSHRRFLAAAFACALIFTAIFLYIASANPLLIRDLHLRETQFFWLFGPVTGGMAMGGWLSGRVAGRWSAGTTVAVGFGLMALASVSSLLFHATHAPAVPWTLLPLSLYGLGMSLTMPTLTLMGLDFFPAHRGLASSCQAFVLTAGNALTAGLLSPWASSSPLRLSAAAFGLLLLGALGLPVLFARTSPAEERRLDATLAEPDPSAPGAEPVLAMPTSTPPAAD